MTREQLEEIKRRAEKATPGPWTSTFVNDLLHYGQVIGDVPTKTVLAKVMYYKETDAPFIAHAREDVPALIAALEEAWASADEAWLNRDNAWADAWTKINSERDALRADLENLRQAHSSERVEWLHTCDALKAEVERLNGILDRLDNHFEGRDQ